MSTLLTTRVYIPITEESFYINYVHPFSEYITHVTLELEQTYLGAFIDEQQNKIKSAVMDNVIRELENFKRELADMKSDFLNYFNDNFNTLFDNFMRKLNSWVVRQKTTAQQILAICSIYKNNLVAKYEALLEITELPQKAKKIIMDLLSEIKKFEKSVSEQFEKMLDTLYLENKSDTKAYEEKETKQKTLERAKNLISLIEYIDSEYYRKHVQNRGLLRRIEEANTLEESELILEELKIKYIKLKKEKIESDIYREELIKIANQIDDEEVRKQIEKITNKKIINKQQFEQALNFYTKNKYKSQELMKDNFVEILKSFGYPMLIQDKFGIVYFDTNFGKEYKIRLKFDGENITFQFVRLIDGEESQLSEYERQVDMRKAKEFCTNLDSFIDLLEKKYGIKLDIKKRIEPEERMFYIRWKDIPELIQLREEKKKDEKVSNRLNL